MKRTIGILAGALLAASCGGGDDGGGESSESAAIDSTADAESGSTTEVSLVPLEDAQAAQDAAKTVYGTVGGDSVKIDSITFAVSKIGDPTDHDGSPVLPVDVRVENPSSKPVDAPDLELHCANDPATHYLYSGSTYPPEDRTMPPGTFTEGTSLMDFPDGCTDAYIEVSPTITTDRTPIVRFLIDTTATPPTAPSTTVAVTEGDIDTPGEAAAALVAAGITCDRYLDSPPAENSLGPPTIDGTCENGDKLIQISIFEGDAASTMDALLPSYAELFKSYGIDGFAAVVEGRNSYGVEPLDGATESVPSDSTLELLSQIADATGGELKRYEF